MQKGRLPAGWPNKSKIIPKHHLRLSLLVSRSTLHSHSVSPHAVTPSPPDHFFLVYLPSLIQRDFLLQDSPGRRRLRMWSGILSSLRRNFVSLRKSRIPLRYRKARRPERFLWVTTSRAQFFLPMRDIITSFDFVSEFSLISARAFCTIAVAFLALSTTRSRVMRSPFWSLYLTRSTLISG